MTDPVLGSVVIEEMNPIWSLLLNTYSLVRAQEEKSKITRAHQKETCVTK